MDLKVVKFGGSSLSDAEHFKKVADIIKSDPSRRIVVASAPGKRFGDDVKVTDLLYRCYECAMDGGDLDAALSPVRERFEEIARELSLDFPLGEEFQLIRDSLLAKSGRDYAASRGEYLCSKLLAAYLDFEFVDAADCMCFRTNGSFDWEVSNRAVYAALNRVERGVVPGFYGADELGQIHTFSRGGSDVTGAVAARSLGADMYENWTDVPGVLMADPRVVPDPKPIATLSYKELRELSYMGATVLHEDAVFPVRKAGIPINIRSTDCPSAAGTMIVPVLTDASGGAVTGIAGRKGFSVISIEKAMMNSEIGFGRRVLEILERSGISFEHIPSGIDGLSVVVATDALAGKRRDIMDDICAAVHPDAISLEDGLALIAVVGHGMVHTKGIAARVFSSIAAAGVNIRMLDQGAGELSIILGVEDADYERAIRAIYDEFEGS